MNPPNFTTARLTELVEQMRAGNRAAGDELIRPVQGRLERLARRMLRGFPAVRRFEQTGDVLQNAWVRLLRALESVEAKSTAHFFNLAAEQIRRELIDLSRHYGSRLPAGPMPGSDAANDPAPDQHELDRWTAFHEAVEGLPADEREVFGLRFYHGWAVRAVAELMQVSEREVGRRWHSACVTLAERLGNDIPK